MSCCLPKPDQKVNPRPNILSCVFNQKHRPLDCFFWTRKDLSLISECKLFCWSHLTWKQNVCDTSSSPGYWNTVLPQEPRYYIHWKCDASIVPFSFSLLMVYCFTWCFAWYSSTSALLCVVQQVICFKFLYHSRMTVLDRF